MTWSITVTVDKQTYPLPVAQKAVYALSPTLSILIHQTPCHLDLHISPTDTRIDARHITEASARTLVIQSLNDFALREQVLQETAGLRELLARAALKEVGL